MPTKILIVDDEADIELLIRQRFRREIREGVFDFLFARNGEEALAIVQANPEIEVVLTDINMPVMDGLTLLTRLQERPDPPATVIVSAYGDMPNIRTAMNRGAFDFLTKPIDFHDFEVTVQKTLAQVRRLRAALADRDRLVALDRDLAIAADIQRSFLPAAGLPDVGGSDFALHATMLPAHAVGGDFYDYFALENGQLGVVIGDVSGKGVPAALLMAVTRTLLRACAQRGAAPGPCLEEVNRLLLRDTSAERFVTLFYGIVDARRGELSYANGGHNPPLLLRASGAVEELPDGGLVVGVVPGVSYETKSVRLNPGDQLFLYTDGIPEAMNARREQFSLARLLEVVSPLRGAAPEELVNQVVDAVRQFTAGAAQSDDLTALAVLPRGSTATKREEEP
ncbi:MAG TPA: SpoIIE family protein phosphatase [Gemmataceae bacterium]|nr:SpoIIE family protein phosphatase [Gemmataceae bacterium]